MGAVSEGDHASSYTPATGVIEWEEEDQGVWSMRLRGTIADHRVTASVAVVGDAIHLFTKVRVH